MTNEEFEEAVTLIINTDSVKAAEMATALMQLRLLHDIGRTLQKLVDAEKRVLFDPS